MNRTAKKELYRAELTTRTRRRDEDWATYGDVLRTLADKAYSDLEEKARERLALGQFLSNIENPQVAFGVRQKCPETLDAAVRMTIELESYLKITTTPTPVVAAATSADESEPLSKALQLLNERLDKLEVMVVSKSNPSSQEKQDTDRAKDAGKRGPICWNCGKRGHIARRCWSSKNSKQQENFKPSMVRPAMRGRSTEGPGQGNTNSSSHFVSTQWYVEGLCTRNDCFHPYKISSRYGCSSVIIE